MTNPSWDAFICHASEDKESFVRPLAQSLSRYGARVWYDEFTLGLGDSLSRSIDKGLAESRFGVVVLSPSFLVKHWPEYELRGLVAKEHGRDKVILPVWYGVDRDEVLTFSPPLADKVALRATGIPIRTLAVKLVEVIRPDLFKEIRRQAVLREVLAESKAAEIPLDRITKSPIRHERLPSHLVRRIRLLRAVFLEVFPDTMNSWLNSFRRDADPLIEISWWEHVAACFLEYTRITKLSKDQRVAVFGFVMHVASGQTRADYPQDLSSLPAKDLDLLEANCRSANPIWELKIKGLDPGDGDVDPAFLDHRLQVDDSA